MKTAIRRWKRVVVAVVVFCLVWSVGFALVYLGPAAVNHLAIWEYLVYPILMVAAIALPLGIGLLILAAMVVLVGGGISSLFSKKTDGHADK